MPATVATCVYELPRPMWISLDVLGQRLDTRIGPVQVVVVTPELLTPQGRTGTPVLTEVPKEALAAIVGDKPARLDLYPPFAAVIDPEWCIEFAAHHRGQATALRAIGLELLDSDQPLDGLRVYREPHDQLFNAVVGGLEGWFSRLAQWVSILTGQDLNHRHQLFDAAAIAPGVRVWRGGSWQSGPMTMNVPTKTPIGLDDLREILERVNTELPALEWQLMHSGTAALDRDNYRTAVLDCATAVEVCLANLMKTSTAQANRPASRLTNWSDWLHKNDDRYTRDDDFTDGLVSLRNDVVHRGALPTYDQARRAYDCACRIVATHGARQAPWRTVTPPGQ